MAKEKGAEGAGTIELAQLRDLFEQMAAGNDPIRPDQLARFTKRPDGPLMPYGCMRSWYLRDDYGDNREWLDEDPVLDIICRDDGKCYLLTSDWRHLSVYNIEADYAFRLQNGRGESLLGCHARFLGIAQGRSPVTMVTHKSMIADADLTPSGQLDASREEYLCIGESAHPMQGVGACAWLPGDQLMFERCEHHVAQEPSSLYLAQRRTLQEGGALTEETALSQSITSRYKGFWLSPDHGVIAATCDRWGSSWSVTILNHDRHLRLPVGARCHGVVFMTEPVTSTRLLIADRRHGTQIFHWSDEDRLTNRLPQAFPCVTDDAKFTLLPDRRFAYVAQRRHQKRGWVVDGKLQAGDFDLVSNIFHVAGEPRYYGVAGRQILLMKVL